MVTFDAQDHADYLAHYGILRRSGRYPWGSGETQNIRNKSYLDYIENMKSQGMTETEIARGLGISTTQLRAAKTIAKAENKQADIAMAQNMRDKGMSNVAIGERMGINESSVRALLAPGAKDKAMAVTNTSEMLKRAVEEKTFVDIGAGVENHIQVSKEKLKASVDILREQGYEVHNVKVQQVGTGFETEVKVLCPPGTTQKELWLARNDIKQITEFSDDGGRSFDKVYPPLTVNPKRVDITWAEDGGTDADGVIYVRPGVDDISLGNARYAQVRVKVGDGHYLKGMAMYKDDLPDGVDLMFNTNKKRSETPTKLDALKKLEDDPDQPFGTVIRQNLKNKGTDKEGPASAMNIVNEEGDWTGWSKNIASQTLSKQSPVLAKQQLDLTYDRRKRELDEIKSLTNPTIKKRLLEDFAESTDSAAVHLKAAALPRQAWHVILPLPKIKPNEVYAPNYKDGETVALVRYPHGGTFEIPELTVNNRNREAKRLLGDAPDAIGIHPKQAERLSGADFDGDTVLVVPNNKKLIKTTPALEGLKNFDPKVAYPPYEGMKRMTKEQKAREMGDVSNLLTDMTIQGAPREHIVRAVRHSMVVIDAEKHGLNYKLSAERNNIKELKKEYQGGARSGASTLISRATSEARILDRKPRPMKDGGPVDPATGKKVWVETGKTTRGKDGTVQPKKMKVDKLAITDDAHVLSSGTRMEKIYADHSNKLKTMANQARLEAVKTPPLKRDPGAAKTYSPQVSSLNSKLALAMQNKPRERQAQIVAANIIAAKKSANPNLEGDTLKKVRYQALQEARARTGADKHRIKITPDEWAAIQSGAISNNKLNQILQNSDMDQVRQLATPKTQKLMTAANTARAQSMLNAGYTRAEIAQQLGVSLTTLDTATVGEE